MRPAVAAVVLACLTSLMSCLGECDRQGGKGDRETALRECLHDMRKAIDHFYARERRYPRALDELVPRDLRVVKPDPFTKRSSTWTLVRNSGGEIVDVRTSVDGVTCDGTPYSQL